VLGVAVGVMARLIALALMTGLQREVRDRILGSEAHVSVFKDGGIQDVDAEISKMLQLPRVIAAAPALLGKAITSENGLGFIDVKGIDPARESAVTQLRTAMRTGSLEALARSPNDVPAILIGTGLAEALEVEVGDRVHLIQPFDVAVVVASAMAICFVATIYPSHRAARLDPAQALRYQ
jgi:lipoprotein-releasing system permease protein